MRRKLEDRVKGRGKDAASAMANFGNLIMRFVEQFIKQYPPKLVDGKYVHQYESELKDAMSASKYYFEQAIYLDDHFGAHYSLALLLKLHQNLLDYDYEVGGVEEFGRYAYEEMCKSQVSYVKIMQEEGKLFIMDDCNWKGGDVVIRRDGGEDKVYWGEEVFVSKFSDVYVEGRDAAMFGDCQIFLGSHECYLPLFRQFAEADERQTKIIKLGASVLQFSGKEYYHWITEGLSRIVTLQEILKGDPRRFTLVVPKGDPFIEESLGLLGKAYGGAIPPFTSIVVFDEDKDRLRFEELYYADWEVPEGNRNRAGAHLLPPGIGVRKIREVLAGGETEAGGEGRQQNLVLVLRSGSRRFINEDAVVARMSKVAKEQKLQLVKFRGDEGLKATIDIFKEANTVVGVHGGALANIVFCKEGTTVVELAMPEPEFGEYAHLSDVLGLTYVEVGLAGFSLFEAGLEVDVGSLKW
ncbi:hypothetical protein TL16_g04439 [Triparma laevis f. inornata]|uniref:Glycosyltransferase 61 catalytic domain-containing protein n=1 Tax=Triparma laevis f. inornata TaxID=1714386 RepID=A0A9W7AEV4_9STRA|nr:hypothetical protein TL16_g04439 [Triparma laevis f. inornata]